MHLSLRFCWEHNCPKNDMLQECDKFFHRQPVNHEIKYKLNLQIKVNNQFLIYTVEKFVQP